MVNDDYGVVIEKGYGVFRGNFVQVIGRPLLGLPG
jgi:hypothetical protein